jgi:putative glutathione S-transferase
MSATSSATSAASPIIRTSPAYLRDLYQVPGVKETVSIRHIKDHYYRSHKTINPTGIVPVGPELDLDRPHGRGARAA